MARKLHGTVIVLYYGYWFTFVIKQYSGSTYPMNKTEMQLAVQLRDDEGFGLAAGLENEACWAGHWGPGFRKKNQQSQGTWGAEPCSYLWSCVLSVQAYGGIDSWRLCVCSLAQKMPLPKVRIAIKDSKVEGVTHLINEVICFAENLTEAFEGDWLWWIPTPKDRHLPFSSESPQPTSQSQS